MRHASPGELLELHFDEIPAPRRDGLAAHVRDCAPCRSILADVEWAERALALGGPPAPPADGLERVLARVDAVRPVRERRARWLRAAAPCGAALVAGALAVQHGGATAALAFFGVGTLLTLSLAPVLILESQRRS